MKVIGKILGIVLAFVLVAGELTAHSVVLLQQIITPENVKAQILSDDSLYDATIETFAGKYEDVVMTVRSNTGLSDEQAREVLESEPVVELISDMSYYLVGYLKRNENCEVTSARFKDMYTSTIKKLKTEYSIDDEGVQKLETFFDENIAPKYLGIFTAVKKGYSDSFLFKLRFVNVGTVVHATVVLFCIVIGLLIALFIWSFGRAHIYAGLITLLCAVPSLLIGISYIDFSLDFFNRPIVSNLTTLIENSSKLPMMIDAIFSLLVGVWLIIRGIRILHHRRLKRREAEATARAEKEATERRRLEEEKRQAEERRLREEEAKAEDLRQTEGSKEADSASFIGKLKNIFTEEVKEDSKEENNEQG